jgi:hypothetical protein
VATNFWCHIDIAILWCNWLIDERFRGKALVYVSMIGMNWSILPSHQKTITFSICECGTNCSTSTWNPSRHGGNWRPRGNPHERAKLTGDLSEAYLQRWGGTFPSHGGSFLLWQRLEEATYVMIRTLIWERIGVSMGTFSPWPTTVGVIRALEYALGLNNWSISRRAPKLNIHRMCAHEYLFHTYGQKCLQ